MAFSEKFLEELAGRNDIVDVVSSYVALTKKSGANMFGLCPFHSEKTPSFSVSPAKQIFHCFGCGKGGGVISFIMEIENLSFPDAVAFLARRANMPLPEDTEAPETASRRKRLLELNREAARFFYGELVGPSGGPGQAYVARREISPAMVRAFGLGYAPDSWSALTDAMKARGYTERELFEAGLLKHGRNGGGYDAFRNRLMFPVIDVRGSVIGFSGRILGDGEPKYLNSPETPVFSKSHNLFALNLAKKSKSGYIILTEGNIDVVSLHQAGFDSAVASLGTALTPEQARLMKRYTDEVILCYDSDAAGEKAAARGIGILEKLDLRVRVVRLPEAKDPDEFLKKNGPDAFRNVLDASAGQAEYRLADVERKHPPIGDEGRVDYLRAAAAVLASMRSDVEREVYAARAAEKAGVSREAVLSEVARIRKARREAAKKKENQAGTQAERGAQPAIRGLRYDDARSARAEEGLVRLLYLEPALSREPGLPEPSAFSSALLGRFYAELRRRALEGAAVSVPVLEGAFTPEEMSHFVRVVGAQEDLSNSGRALHDYIKIIESRQAGEEGDLKALADALRKTKGYGG